MTLPFSTVVLRLVVALILGAIIGIERESHEQAAGMRTNALVSIGSCLFTIISIVGFSDFLSLQHVQLDPSRIASYIVAGIGFLGAGSIYRSQGAERVKGLTTAATTWVVAAIGMACGTGRLLDAAIVTILALAVLILLRLVEGIISPRKASTMCSFSIEVQSVTDQLVQDIYAICDRLHVKIDNLQMQSHLNSEGVKISIVCELRNSEVVTTLLKELQGLSGVRGIHMNLQNVAVHEKISLGK